MANDDAVESHIPRIKSQPGKQKKYHGQVIVRVCAKHNLREISKEYGQPDSYIDASRTVLNYILSGASTSDGVAKAQDEIMADVEIPDSLRSNTIRAFEMVFTIPLSASHIDDRIYFADCLAWQRQYFGAPIVSAVAHLDEAVKHCHIIMLAVKNGRLDGSGIWQGKNDEQKHMLESFHSIVATKHGLLKPDIKRHASYAHRCAWAELIVSQIEEAHGRFEPFLRGDLMKLVAANPYRLATTLNVQLPDAQQKKTSFAAIMTKKVQPEKVAPFPKGNEIGAGFHLPKGKGVENGLLLSCVGKAIVTAHKAATASHSLTATDGAESYLVRTTASDDAHLVQTAIKTDTTSHLTDGQTPATSTATATTCAQSTPQPSARSTATDAPTTDTTTPDGAGRKRSGRKAKIIDVGLAMQMRAGGMSMGAIAEYFGCKKSTLYKLLPHPTKTLAQRQQPGLFG